MSDSKTMLATYLRQQIELGMPDPIFSSGFSMVAEAPVAPVDKNPIKQKVAEPAVGFQLPKRTDPPNRTIKAKPLANLGSFSVPSSQQPAAPISEDKRELMKKLYYEYKSCALCGLSKTRTTFVFGSGNVDAPVLVIGEAPGADEDAQGLPFVGRAGKLLTEMLSAIHLDRKKDTFITNILKCRPPENRTPESGEIIKCMPLLKKQIDIIKPRVILLLGRIAAHSLLDCTDSLAKLREEQHSYLSIPVIVTYHPAALLRSPEYKRPAWEDLQKLQKLLEKLGVKLG
jgi:uracil-DNA glycosylase